MKAMTIVSTDIAALATSALASTAAFHVAIPSPIVPFSFSDYLMTPLYSIAAPFLTTFGNLGFDVWFLSRAVCATLCLVLLLLIASQLWRKTKWSMVLGAVAIVAWMCLGAFIQYCAVCASV
jgi:hypothetical protein